MSRMATLLNGRGYRKPIVVRGLPLSSSTPFGFRNVAFPIKVTSAPLSSSHYASLPPLPVPQLQATLQKFLKTVKPHVNNQEMAMTALAVKEFGAPDGVGIKLQALLEKRAHSKVNWLEDWWLLSSYLDYRSPVVVYSNPGHVWPFRTFSTKEDQLRHAARIILGVLDYKDIIDGDKLPQDKAGKDPLDMAQYKKVIGTCRIPGKNRDTLSYNNSNHISVFHNNHIFILSIIGEDGVRLNEEQLVKQLNDIVANSSQILKNPIGVLTTEHRDNWGKTYALLLKDETNKYNLKEIEQSLFSICLDASSNIGKLNYSEKQTVAAEQTIHGGGSKSNSGNRWFDKTLQFIIGEDGINGLTYEHSPAEGQPVAVLVDHVIDFIDGKKYLDKSPSKLTKNVSRLDFNISQEIEEAIKLAKINIDKLVANLEVNSFTFNMYGKEFIKSQKLSPDSFIQMAIQYAFYRVHKIAGAHYETASTRKYVGGRTETIRSCSEESIAFSEVMLNPNSTIQERIASLQNAIKAHKDYTVEASNGFGVDRHLLGLKLTAIENGIPLPKLYTDTGFVKSSTMRISTSQVASKCEGFMCFGPLVPDGYAVCYNPRPGDIVFSTSAFRENSETSARKYRKALEDSLTEMHNVLLKSIKSKL